MPNDATNDRGASEDAPDDRWAPDNHGTPDDTTNDHGASDDAPDDRGAPDDAPTMAILY